MISSTYYNSKDPQKKADALVKMQEIERRNGIVSETDTNKVMSKADVAETAKRSGKTEQQVIEQAQSQGYTIK